jgi:hypothetical protein
MRHVPVQVVLLALLLAATQWAAPAVHASGHACFAQYHATCYSATDVATAERTMAIPPVNPTPAVVHAAHLPLVRVVTEQSQALRRAPTVITYSYGIAIALDRPMPRTGRPAIFVTEFVLPKLRPYSGVKSQPGTISSVLATFPHKKLALLVAGHFPLRTLRQIALATLGK